MIIFIEERSEVAQVYRNYFHEVGEIVNELNAEDFMSFLNTSSSSDLASVEALLIGRLEDPEQLMKAARSRLNVPMIALLDSRCLLSLAKFYKSGVDDVVVKPIHKDELRFRIAAIKRRIIRNAMPTAVGAQAEKLVVYFDGRDPEYRRKPLGLPRRERRILEYLATVGGRRVSKRQIFDAVYGILDEITDETIIESHISKLRKKLRMAMGYDPIESKRFLGYRLEPSIVTIIDTVSLTQVA